MILSKIKAILYAIEFIISVILIIFFMWLFPKHMHKARRIWARIQRFFGLYEIEIVGEPDLDANIILINHQSMLDIIVMEEIYPKNLSWVAKKEIGDIPIIGKILTLPKMLPIDRSPRGIVNLIKEAKDRLQSGRVIAIFPEGTRGRGEKLLKFQVGAKVLTEKLNLKAQPVVIVGTNIMDAKRFSFKNGKIKIIYMPLIDTTNERWLENTRDTMQQTLSKELAR
ncbi:1-acyl-sn-glycerol-3-phosphate acyltransferase [Campylobacter sp. faydin G-140]|uniref:lysophospholipid acyltransferase family protein n=1 Tax=Campylobacter anatolicus TaxID=2829105 RepID=UPI001B9DA94E|nr:lysophospholipid acyltransferase family protein [Campylobacter anatolicus]MBR8465823.1 1-acyl-sn-glycerol-3-phosphate acyltransferase [Campylobacter anatolicus]